MPTFELILSAKAWIESRSGASLIYEGDIIDYKPEGHQWGTKELAEWRCITVTGLTREEIEELKQAQYEDELTKEAYDIEIGKYTKEQLLSDPSLLNRGAKISKRRYKIPIDILKTYDPNIFSQAEMENE